MSGSNSACLTKINGLKFITFHTIALKNGSRLRAVMTAMLTSDLDFGETYFYSSSQKKLFERTVPLETVKQCKKSEGKSKYTV